MARAFVGAGARVALADLDENQLEAAEQELMVLTGDSSAVATSLLDVRDREPFALVGDTAGQQLGPDR